MKTAKILVFIVVFTLFFGTACKSKQDKTNAVNVESEKNVPTKSEARHELTPGEVPCETPAESMDFAKEAPRDAAGAPMEYSMRLKSKKLQDSKDGYSKYEKHDWEDDSIEERKDLPTDGVGTEKYTEYVINKFIKTEELSLSTFAIDVDTASYTIMRGKIKAGQLPPPSSVRVEEYLNYFDYKYPAPSTGLFTVYSQIAENPFNSGETSLLRVALRAKDISNKERRTAHLTFMVDVSGSMNSTNKLGYVKQTLKTIVKNLRDDDTIAICTYASQARKLLKPTPIDKKEDIYKAIDSLGAGGSTSGEAGLRNAYELAEKGFVKGHINRIIMCTDGDFNVGNTDGKSLAASVNHYARKGITFSAVGYGMGNYKDNTIEAIANAGNGNYFYIDSVEEINRVFEKNLVSTLDVVAADVKIQVEFNPSLVQEYRLIGYENRALTAEQFRDDIVDAGEVGAGHSVTAIYELMMGNANIDTKIPKDLKGS
ncbi:MAG: von Willebrand factor type A domain-containing protein, partial [Planctomycetes bacterium]|nr:von Willebrand factor type A domain-containing protein [Planctomycetota bacterium]